MEYFAPWGKEAMLEFNIFNCFVHKLPFGAETEFRVDRVSPPNFI